MDDAIDGMLILRAKGGADARGRVREFYRHSDFTHNGARPLVWRQINVTTSVPGAVRGLHGEPMSKLVGLAAGEALGAYVDARSESTTFGNVRVVALTPGTQVFVPAGVCNGFQTSGTGDSVYVYAFDDEWRADVPGVAVNPLDAALGVQWPLDIDPRDRSRISQKDAGLPTFAELFGVAPRLRSNG